MSVIKTAALAYGKAGLKVFPILEGTKDQPLIKQWGVRASSDAAQITAWWDRWPEANIGLACMASGIAVVDSDAPNGEATLDALAVLEGKALSPTRMARSPRGGIHRFYRGAVATTVAKIGPNVDTRGVGSGNGGYVLLAPSRTKDGAYAWLNKEKMAPVDAWVIAACGATVDTNRGPASQEPVVELDQDSNIKWARDWLMTAAPKCLQGAGGDDTFVKRVVPVLKDHGISEEMAAEIIGEPGGYNETKCDPPWQWPPCDDRDNLLKKIHNAYLYLKQNAPGARTAAVDFAGTEDESEAIAAINAEQLTRRMAKEWASRGKESGGLALSKAADVKSRKIDYLWPLRLAYGKHTAFAGEGGGGKTTVACDIAARITKGLAWPDGSGNATVGSVLILNAEDDPADTLVPRLIAAGADLDKIRFIDAVKTDKGERKFSLLEDLNRLKAACQAIGDVALIIIDPASSYMGGAMDGKSNIQIRNVLDPLGKFAREVNCAVLSITHFKKGTGARAVEKVIDSVAFTTAPRAVFGFFRDPDSPEQQEQDFGPGIPERPSSSGVMFPLKINIGKWPLGLKYKIEEAEGGTDYRDQQPITSSCIKWGDATPENADDFLARTESTGGNRAPRLSEAITWLENTLSDAPEEGLEPSEVEAQADAAGITKQTLRRARQSMRNVESVALKGKAPPERRWRLKSWTDRRFSGLDLDAPAPEKPAGVPFMITVAMKAELSKLGYGPENVATMTPQQAKDILDAKRPAWSKPEADSGPNR